MESNKLQARITEVSWRYSSRILKGKNTETQELLDDGLLDFDGHGAYLSWRAEWRELYALVGQSIRELKVVIKQSSREGMFDSASNRRLLTAQTQARTLMLVRTHSKFLAAAQYQKEHMVAA